jgi:hypothetical protein
MASPRSRISAATRRSSTERSSAEVVRHARSALSAASMAACTSAGAAWA